MDMILSLCTCFTARYTTSISTLVAIIGAFFDSQITFCCMLRVDKTQQNTEPDNNSDVDYIMPRVCFQFLYFIHKIIILLCIHLKSIIYYGS